MKKFFYVALFCTSLFSYAMDPRDTDDKMVGSGDLARRSSSDLRVNVLRGQAGRSSSPQAVIRSPRFRTNDDKDSTVPNLSAVPKKLD